MRHDFNDVVAADVLHGRIVRLRFENGDLRDIDLTPLLTGPAFSAIATDDELFRQLQVDSEVGTISWPNGADISPTTLFRHSNLVHSETG